MIKQKDGFLGQRSIVLPLMIREMEAHDPLISSLYITDIGYYPHAKHHYRERKEPIPQYVLLYCFEGRGHYRINSEAYSIHANQYCILPAGKTHVYWSDETDPWTLYWVHFTGDHAIFFSEGAEKPQNIQPCTNSRIRERNHIFEEIFATLEDGCYKENLRYASSLLHYYLASMRYLTLFRNADNRKENEERDIVSAAIHYMQENLEKKLTLADLSTYSGYSTSYLSKLFKRKTGQSPLNYFNLLKIRFACRILKDTDMKINQICFKIGIIDSYYFSRFFSKIMGMPPMAYRKKAKLLL